MKKIPKKTVAVIIGTRPEVIKTASTIKELQSYPKKLKTVVIATGQHNEMLYQALNTFKIKPDYDLQIMKESQSLSYITTSIIQKLEKLLTKLKPNLVVVQGDTPSTFAAALTSFFLKIPIAHIESGARSYKKYAPFPEEMNRQLTDTLSDLHFAISKFPRNILIKEGKLKEKIYITGSTSVDAAVFVMKKKPEFKTPLFKTIDFKNKRIILLTTHRRESWGKKMEEILKGVRDAVKEFDDIEVIFPMHLNKKVITKAMEIFSNESKFHLLPPLDYEEIILLLKKCYLVATDSGGLQEEATFFSKPTLILRDVKVIEKVEALKAGSIKVVGIKRFEIYNSIKEILLNKSLYNKMSTSINPYGIGTAGKKITKEILKYINNTN